MRPFSQDAGRLSGLSIDRGGPNIARLDLSAYCRCQDVATTWVDCRGFWETAGDNRVGWRAELQKQEVNDPSQLNDTTRQVPDLPCHRPTRLL